MANGMGWNRVSSHQSDISHVALACKDFVCKNVKSNHYFNFNYLYPFGVPPFPPVRLGAMALFAACHVVYLVVAP